MTPRMHEPRTNPEETPPMTQDAAGPMPLSPLMKIVEAAAARFDR